MKSKGSANIWWIIIGAVIALVVLIILLVIFTSRTTPLTQELGNCKGKGGVCMPADQDCPSGTLSAATFSCGEAGKCCLGAAKICTNSEDCQICTVDLDGKNWCA